MNEAEKLRREARAMGLLQLARRFDTRIETTQWTARAWARALGGRDYDELEQAVVDYYVANTYPLMVAHLARKVREPGAGHVFNPQNVTHQRLVREYRAANPSPLITDEAVYRIASMIVDEQLHGYIKSVSGPAAVAKASGL